MKKILVGLLGATALSLTPAMAHNEPDFSKLPEVKPLIRYAVASTLIGIEKGRRPMGQGTMFKIGEENGLHYYATANHLSRGELPKPKDITNVVYDEWHTGGQKMKVEARDEANDVMILSTTYDFGDEALKECKEKPEFGEMSYVYGYSRGHLMLGSGRVGGLEDRLMGDGKDYYSSDVDALAGASGSPSLLYRDNDFCAYGMLLGNIDGGFFSVSGDIENTLKLYKEVLSKQE